MQKYVYTALSLFLLVLLPFSKALAADFAVTHIGALDLGGKRYTEWWYSVENPTLRGTAEDDADVTIKINDESDEVTADGSGNWIYPTQTPKGDYTITVSASNGSYTFQLHTGQNMPASTTGSTSETTGSAVPQTGFNQLYTIFISLVLISAGYAIFSGNSVKKEFEKAFVKESQKS